MKTNDAIINFVYFSANFPYDFIESVWKEQPALASHFREKIRGYSAREGKGYISLQSFFSWFFELTEHNQKTLLDWVHKHYNHKRIPSIK